MAEIRKFETVICVKNGAKTAFRIELFCAEQWANSAQGRYRCRVNRRWRNGSDGKPAYLDLPQIGELVAELAGGDAAPTLEPPPDLPRGSRVSAPNGNVVNGQALYDLTQTVSDPIRAHDGRWYVLVLIWERGHVFVPVDTLQIKTLWKDGRHSPVKEA